MGSAPSKKHIVYFKHPMLGDVTPKERYGTKQMIYKHAVPPSTDLPAWELSYQSLELDNRDFLFLPFDYRVNTKQGYCCTELAELTYQLYQHILDSEVVNRRLNQKNFTEQELWYLLYNVLESCKDFEFREGDEQKIGDIRPKNILLNDMGKIKLINKWSWPGEGSGLEKLLNSTGDKCYVAPEELKVLALKGAQPLNQHKTDVFSIGVSFIELSVLKSSEDLYDYKNCRLNEQLLGVRKQDMSRLYSDYYCKVIDSLADMNVDTRCTCGETWAILNPYAQDINLLKKFTPSKSACQTSLKNYKKKLQRRLKK